jgi:hypothetical protein
MAVEVDRTILKEQTTTLPGATTQRTIQAVEVGRTRLKERTTTLPGATTRASVTVTLLAMAVVEIQERLIITQVAQTMVSPAVVEVEAELA